MSTSNSTSLRSKYRDSPSAIETPWGGVYPSVAAIAPGRSAGSTTEASSHIHDAVGVFRQEFGPDLQRKASLADTPDADDRDNAVPTPNPATARSSSSCPTKLLNSYGKFDR